MDIQIPKNLQKSKLNALLNCVKKYFENKLMCYFVDLHKCYFSPRYSILATINVSSLKNNDSLHNQFVTQRCIIVR